MSDRVRIFDTTLRDGEQSPGATMNLQEKLRLAHQLEVLGVDCIEAGFPASSQGDFESVQAIAGLVKNSEIAGLARCTRGDIDRVWEAIRHAAQPRIHTFLATSPIHMEYKLRKSPEQVVEMAVEGVKRAAGYTPNVEFSAEDASRSNPDFLVRVVTEVIKAGRPPSICQILWAMPFPANIPNLSATLLNILPMPTRPYSACTVMTISASA